MADFDTVPIVIFSIFGVFFLLTCIGGLTCVFFPACFSASLARRRRQELQGGGIGVPTPAYMGQPGTYPLGQYGAQPGTYPQGQYGGQPMYNPAYPSAQTDGSPSTQVTPVVAATGPPAYPTQSAV